MDTESVNEREGFPALANKIAIVPDYDAFIFRRFDRLSARNLLHLEGKLAYLEWKLDQADAQTALNPDTESLRSIRVWEAFEENAKDKSRPEHGRMKIAVETAEALREYQEALIRQHEIAMLENPKKRALDVANSQSYEYVYDPVGQERLGRPVLSGLSGNRLCEHNHRDLVAVRQPADKDPLSRFLQDHWLFKTTKISDDIEHIAENQVVWTAAIISSAVAALLLLGAIFSLRHLDQGNAQLGVISMFTILFAVSVRILTNARRAEIFAATAAYAAILVVFVSSDPRAIDCVCSNVR